MLTTIHRVQKFLRIVAVVLFASCGANMALAQSVPMLVQAEAMTLVAPMAAGNDIAAMGGRFISATSGTSTTSPVRSASVQVNVSTAGTYYLWARIAGPTDLSDALYVGIDTSFARIFPSALGPYQWVKVATTNGSGVFGFSLAAGTHTIQVGYGEIGAKLDAVYLTADAAEVPAFTAPQRLAIEAEAFNLAPPMTVGSDPAANGGQYVSPTSGMSSTTPVREASTTVHVPAGTWYLWARIAGPTSTSDALYIGINTSFDRVFPSAQGPYQWVRVETTDGSGIHGFALSAGAHTIQVGHGEIGARLDAVYVTNDSAEVPSFAPMRRVIEAESFNLTAPMTVGVDADANAAQYISPTSGTDSTVPVREASTTVTAPTAGTYYLWARLKGSSIGADALYVGFDNSWDRVFPSTTGTYEWARVETADGSGVHGFSLSAGQHIIQVGHGEIGARLDALYVTDDANDTPAGPAAPPPAGPCAIPSGGYEGFGRATRGGIDENGVPLQIVHVTNLNDSGAGSLRAALSAANRCIVFDVSGVINLNSSLKVLSNVTIDGFTAPAPGITLMNNEPPSANENNDPPALSINGGNPANPSTVGNVVVRGIRVRKAPGDGISVFNATNVVIDHVSVTGYRDGALDITRNSRDVTVQWSILANGNGQSDKVNLNAYNATRVTLHHNLYINGDDRQPYCGIEDGASAFLNQVICDFRNNLIWEYDRGTTLQDMATANIVDNYYSSSRHTQPAIHTVSGQYRAFISGNFSTEPGSNINSGSNWPEFPAVLPAATDPRTAARAVRASAGARGPNFGLDATDQGFINQISIP
jgi:pectate lyase